MGRRTRTRLPTAENLLKLQPLDSVLVQTRLKQQRRQQKKFYDSQAKELSSLKEGDLVRMETDKRFKKQGVVEKDLMQPRSYLVKSNGVLYRRNRNHLLKTGERETLESGTDENVENVSRSLDQTKNQTKQIVTRS